MSFTIVYRYDYIQIKQCLISSPTMTHSFLLKWYCNRSLLCLYSLKSKYILQWLTISKVWLSLVNFPQLCTYFTNLPAAIFSRCLTSFIVCFLEGFPVCKSFLLDRKYLVHHIRTPTFFPTTVRSSESFDSCSIVRWINLIVDQNFKRRKCLK